MSAENGAKIDPVCRMEVDPKTAPFKEEYGGKTYYFDAKECWEKFKQNPQAYPLTEDPR